MKDIRILGPGCAHCKQVKVNVSNAVMELGIEADTKHVTDLAKILEFEITNNLFEILDFEITGMPALVIDQ
ncbi:MAG: thioredoxin family protein [Candidatus Heimdallarchaeota archaeon]